MTQQKETKAIRKLSNSNIFLFGLIVFCFYLTIFYYFPPPSIDWKYSFYPASQHLSNPYLEDSFLNLPWTIIFLYPFHFLSYNLSAAINASLNVIVFGALVIRRKGGLSSLFLTLTSFPFISLILNGNIDWLPALGFFMQDGIGVIFLLTKPQSGSLAILDWYFRSKNKAKFIFLPALTFVSSFLIWGNWPVRLIKNIVVMSNTDIGLLNWSYSLFPWTVPIGLAILFYIVKHKPENGELLGVIATFCLAPYFSSFSLTILIALLSISHKRISILLWISLWIYQLFFVWNLF